MLVRGDGLCIGQTSHAWLSEQLARAWAQPFARHEDVCLAAGQHDVGWVEWDLAPTLDASTGLPRAFTAMDRRDHVAIWETAASRVLMQNAYAALLVSLHGTGLYEPAAPATEHAELIEQFLTGQHALQERLIAELGVDADELRTARELIAVWDVLSLALCLGWEPIPHLDPWPFRDAVVELRCEGRRLTERYDSEESMRAAFAGAAIEPVTFTLRRNTATS